MYNVENCSDIVTAIPPMQEYSLLIFVQNSLRGISLYISF